MATTRFLSLGLGLAIGVSMVPLAPGQGSSLTEADQEAFAWFDRLGFPACAGKPFVCLTRTSDEPKGAGEPCLTSGFLLEESPESYTIVGADVFPKTLLRQDRGYRVTKGPSKLRRIAAECLHAIRAQVRTGSRGGVLPALDRLCNGPVGGLGTPAAVFVVVRLLREDGTVAAASTLQGVPLENYDMEVFGETWGCVGAFRGLAPGAYCIEASTRDGPLPGTPRTLVVSATDPTLLELGRV